jgi:hypothetical protein
MMVPLRLGPLKASPFIIRRSALNWLCEDGHFCRAGEVVGFCTLTLELAPGERATRTPLADELDLQLAIAPRYSGRLKIGATASPGGYLGVHGLQTWDPAEVVAQLELVDSYLTSADYREDLRLLFLAGRRMSGLADVDTGLLSGWHSRSRAWWGEENGPSESLLCIGICDAAGIIRGNKIPFVETFEAVLGAAQVVFVPDHPVLPCAPLLLDQLTRSDSDIRAISADLSDALTAGPDKATSEDWLFAGALLSWLERSPMQDNYDVLTPAGLRRLGPPKAVLLSLSAEAQTILRHKKLGYRLQMLRHRQASAGPAVRAWLASAFEPVKRTIPEIHRDYRLLADAVSKHTGAKLFVINRMSTSGYEDIVSYAPFDEPMSDTLENIAAKDMNLTLHELTAECDISIIDADAAAAELGGAEHLPDGIHHSAAMQAILRNEIFDQWSPGRSLSGD